MDSHRECDEAQLIRLIQTGSPYEAERAFQRLYEANDPKLRRILVYKGLQAFEIDDVCATAWDRALERIENYIPEGIPYLVWLRRTANYVIQEMYRLKQQNQCHTQPMQDDFDVEGHDMLTYPLLSLLEAEDEEEAERRRQEIKGVLGPLIKKLPRDYQDVIEALYEMGLSREETADILGWKQRKVYDTIYRAKTRLKAMLLEYGITDASWNDRQEDSLRSH